jgi:phage minor structural protein
MLFILDKKQRPVGVANHKSPKGLAYFNDVQHEAIENNLNVFEFDVPANNPFSSIIEEEGYVIYTDLDNRQQLYVIKNIVESYSDDSMVTVSCEHASTGDLLNDWVKPTANMASYTLTQALEYALEFSDWELGNVDDMGILDLTFDNYTTVKEAINTIAKEFGAELEFEVIFDGAVVKKKLIHAVAERGQKTGVTLEVTKDLTEIEREVNTDSLITAVYAVGKDGLTLIGSEIGQEAGYLIKDDFIEAVEAFQTYSLNGRHKFGLYEDESTNRIELYRNAVEYLKANSKPRFTYTVSMVTLERLTGYAHKKVRIGDTIVVRDFKNRPNEPLILEARVVEVKRSKTDPTADEVVLGDYVKIDFSSSDEITRLQNVVKLNQQQVEEVSGSITPDNVTDMVVSHQDFETIIGTKANAEDLGNYISVDEWTQKEIEIEDKMDTKIDNIDFTPYATKKEVQETADGLDFKFSSSGGVNLLKNSVGYSGMDFWEVLLDEDAYGNVTGSIDTTNSSDVQEHGVGSGFVLSGAKLRQKVTTTQQSYTVSVIVKKASSGTGYIKVIEGSNEHVQNFVVGTAYDYVKVQVTFKPTGNNVTVELYGDEDSEIVFTGVMFNIGLNALQWQHSAGEVYNTNVLMDLNGVRVISNQYEGYTAITPEEFAGYAEISENGITEMKKVFTLNKDVTEMAKVKVEGEIAMSPIKVIPVNDTTYKGWAFIPDE